MNALALDRPGEAQEYAQSWAISVVVHGTVVALSILMVSDLKLAVQPEPFTWDVSVVESPAPQPAEEVKPPPPPPEKTPPTPQRQLRREVVQPRPTVEAQPVKTQPVVERVIRKTEVRETRPIVEAKAIVEPVTQPEQTISRTAEPVQTRQPVEAPQPIVEQQAPVQGAAPVQPEVTPVTEPQAVVRELNHPQPIARDVISEPAPVGHADTLISQRIVEAAQPAPIESPVARQSTPVPQERPVMHEPATTTPSPAPIEQASVKNRPVRSIPRAKADYGWLAEALWSRVEKLKRYPAIARMNRWEGKVVLRAVIKDNGDVAELEIAESSGHAVLDRDAIEVLRRASPIRLKHPLGQPEVVVHVPISYQLHN